MKIKLYNILLAAGLFFFASCSSDDDNTGTNSSPIIFKVNASLLDTRSVTDDGLKSVFEAGDEIGIYAVKRVNSSMGSLLSSGNYADNMKYVKQSGDEWTSDSPIVYPNDGDILDFYAYYPYSADVADATAIAFSVLADQSGDEDEKSDLMTCKNEAPAVTTNEVELVFTHQLALVQLEVVASTTDIDVQEYLTSAVLRNVVPNVVLNLSSGALTGGATEANVIMRKVDNGSDTASAIYHALVPAQTLENGTDLFSLTYTGKGSYGYSLSQDVILGKGKVKKFKLTITGDAETLSVLSAGSNVDNWTSGNAETGDDVSVKS